MNRNACLEEFYPIYVIHLNIYENLFTLKKKLDNLNRISQQGPILNGESEGARGMRPPPPSKFFQFHAVFGKIW